MVLEGRSMSLMVDIGLATGRVRFRLIPCRNLAVGTPSEAISLLAADSILVRVLQLIPAWFM